MWQSALIVIPVFAIIAAGYAGARTALLTEGAAKGIAEFAFSIAVPAFMLRTIATTQLPDLSPLALWGSFFGAVFATWAAATLITRVVLERPQVDAAAIAMSSVFGNVVMLGIPLTLATLGPDAAGSIAVILSLHTPVLWATGTVHHALAEGHGSGSPSWRTLAMTIVGDLVRNPIILSIAAGTIWRTSGLGMPQVVDQTLLILGQGSVPAALVSLGASLVGFQIAGQRATLASIVLLKLLLMPLIGYVLAARVFALPQLVVAIVVLLTAMPTGANAYLFATRHGRAVNSASGAVALGTLLSALTAGVIIYLIRG